MECGTKLGAPEELGERRILTVLFADLSGFTAFSEGSDVEDVHALAQEAADRLSEIVDRYGGTVDKIIGDCVMAVWGAPTTHEDDAERAVRAALDMQTVVANRSEKFFGLRLSTGLYTGEAIWAPIGPDGRYTALGDTVNTAARLQGAAGKGEIYVGTETYRATKDVIEYEEVEPVKAKNKAEPVPAWNAVGVLGARTAAPELPMVGRRAELDRLSEFWELVRSERKPYLAAVTGPPGIGKSRLIRTIADRVEDAAQTWWGRCLDYGDGMTYWPVIEMVKTAAGIAQDEPTEEASRKLGVLLEALGSDDLDELRTMAVALANLIAAPTTPRGTYTATEITKGELHWGIRRVFQLLARRRPVVLVFEDLHWAEPALLELITSFVDIADDAPILLIASGRPEADVETLTAKRQTRRIDVDVLDEADSRALVAHMLGSDVEDGRLIDLLQRAAGNPLFLEETIRMLVDAGALDEEGQIVADKLASLSIPSSLRALIGTRLDRLSGAQKRTAGRASVVGEVFWAGAVAHLDRNVAATNLASDDVDVEAALGQLEDKDVVTAKESSTIADEREWAFRHALIRDVAYQRIPKSERVRLHARCGEWMAARPGATDELVEIVAHHLEQSCLLANQVARTNFAPPVLDAVRALRRAAAKAESRQGTSEAFGYYNRAVTLLGDRFPETSIELRMARARMRAPLGDYQGAYDEMRQIADEALAMRRTDLRCAALLHMAETDFIMGRISEGRTHLDEGDRLARELDDSDLRIRAIFQGAILNQVSGDDPAVAEDALRAAIALADETEDSLNLMYGHTRLGVFLYNAGDLAGAEKALARAAELAQARGSLRHLAWVTFFVGAVRIHRGPREQAAEDLARATDWLERTADRHTLVDALTWRAHLCLATGDVRAAVRLLRIALATARELQSSAEVVRAARALAEAFHRQDRVADAREMAALARQHAPDEDMEAQAKAAIAEAFAAAAEKDETAARQHFTVALTWLEKFGAPIDTGETLIAQADVLESFGDAAGAKTRLERAREIFESVGGAATVAAIDETIERLSPETVVRPLRSSATA
jgi:class 3 adenylate cyclase/tetratricopeptide (TPR) repeat protein